MRCLIHLGDAFFPHDRGTFSPPYYVIQTCAQSPLRCASRNNKERENEAKCTENEKFQVALASFNFFPIFFFVCLKNNAAVTARINAPFNKGDNNIPLYRPSKLLWNSRNLKWCYIPPWSSLIDKQEKILLI